MTALRRSLSLRIGCALLASIALLALVAALGGFDSALAIDVGQRFVAPGRAHWFGTDALGRDVLAMVAGGAATSLGVAAAAVLLGCGIGVPLGLVAAARGGWPDEVLSRTGDLVFAFPSLLLAVLLSASLGPGAATAVIAIGAFNVPVFARLARGKALALMALDFVLAARLAGRGRLAIIWHHLLPNVASLVLVQATIQLSLAIVAEAGLSYVGLGVQPPGPSWGRMLNDAQTLVGQCPWLAAFPGLAIAWTVLGLNLVGEALGARYSRRDAGAGR